MKGVVTVVIGLIIILGCYSAVILLTKYEGKNAREWYYEYTNKESLYNSVKEDAERAQNIRDCVDKTKSLFKDALALCTPKNNCDLNQLANNGALGKVIEEINKSKIDCYSKYFE